MADGNHLNKNKNRVRIEPDAAIWSQEKNKWVYPGLAGLSGLVAEATGLWRAGEGYVVQTQARGITMFIYFRAGGILKRDIVTIQCLRDDSGFQGVTRDRHVTDRNVTKIENSG